VIEVDLLTKAGDRVLNLLEGLPAVYGASPALEPRRVFCRYGVCIDAMCRVPATCALARRWKGVRRLAEKAVRLAVFS
jgi:hypothetical protein